MIVRDHQNGQAALAKGVEKRKAEMLFEMIEKFAGYAFPKAHSTAYALITYQTAYLKANHPREFIAASMTLDMASTDKLAVFSEEARRLGIKLRQPSINASGVDFLPEEGAIRYSLAALRNVGQGLVEAIEQHGEALGLVVGRHHHRQLGAERPPPVGPRRPRLGRGPGGGGGRERGRHRPPIGRRCPPVRAPARRPRPCR